MMYDEELEELTLEEYDKLTKKQQQQLVNKALAWFCVFTELNPLIKRAYEDEVNIIKIVLAKNR